MTIYVRAAALCLLTFQVGFGATPVKLETLLSNSPFFLSAAPKAVLVNEAQLEFRGVLFDGGEYFFSVYDSSNRTSTWVGLNEPGLPITVQSYDANQGTITVLQKGRLINLPLKQAKVATLAQGGPAHPDAAATPATPANVVAAGPDEAARLSAVADEIRRRRSVRAQAQPQPQTPAPAAPVPAKP